MICPRLLTYHGYVQRPIEPSTSLKELFLLHPNPSLKKQLYISLVRSNLCYFCQLWQPSLIKDIKQLETIQHRATKFILSNSGCKLSYKERLLKLDMLPLMYFFDLQDILFFLQSPPDSFDVLQFVAFSDKFTRSASTGKLKYTYHHSSTSCHFYFNRLVRLWNKLPTLDLNLPFFSIKYFLLNHFRDHFVKYF